MLIIMVMVMVMFGDDAALTCVCPYHRGSKELDTSKKSSFENFYGKGVSAPGSKPPRLSSCATGAKLTASTRSQAFNPSDDEEEDGGQSPSIHVTFPVEGYLPGQEASSKVFRKLLKPLAVSDVRLKMAVKSFSMNLSNFIPQIFDDPTGQLNVAIQKFIATPICRRLYGLLCHHVFWNIVHPFAHKVILVCRKEFPTMMYAQASAQSSAMSLESRASMNLSRRESMLSITSPNFHNVDEGVSNEEIKTFDSATSHGFSSDDNDNEHTIQRRTPFSSSLSQDGNDPNHHSNHHPDTDLEMHELASVDDYTQQSNTQCSVDLGSLASTASLSCEEKEMLYLQLEDCISQMHAVVRVTACI
jgi:hypothetical protein